MTVVHNSWFLYHLFLTVLHGVDFWLHLTQSQDIIVAAHDCCHQVHQSQHKHSLFSFRPKTCCSFLTTTNSRPKNCCGNSWPGWRKGFSCSTCCCCLESLEAGGRNCSSQTCHHFHEQVCQGQWEGIFWLNLKLMLPTMFSAWREGFFLWALCFIFTWH